MQSLFPVGDGIFQDDNASIHVAELVQSWFDEHEDEVKYLLSPARTHTRPQYNCLWSILERSIWNRYPPPASLPEFS
ncbi:DDE_3 domain-containing protein [Trichonephila clavipes]|nr:DDE_3 domain-containing protein [Trichonephila clavipes]